MLDLHGAVLATSTVRSVGVLIALLVTVGFVWYAIANLRAGREEIGAELELAPNRKPYYDDETLEGPRLTQALSAGLVLLAVVSVGLPLYWLNEPGRMTGAVDTFDRTFVNRGAGLFATTAEGGLNCAGCHGAEGVGGVAEFTLTDADNEFVAGVTWLAPALDTILLRYDEDEVRDVLVYGRPGTPMPAWGEEGGGPLTTQQIDELIAYMASIQISSEEAKARAEEQLRKELDLGEGEEIDYRDPVVGETLFNLGLGDGFAGGAYSCARCHTKGASIVDGSAEPADADLSEHVGFEAGSGAFGFNLTDGVVPRQFLTLEDLIDFLREGSEFGLLYGQRGQGSGRMPGFGDNPNTEEPTDDGMLTEGMLAAVARYVASLGEGRVDADQVSGAGTTTTTGPTSGGAGASPTTTTTEEP